MNKRINTQTRKKKKKAFLICEINSSKDRAYTPWSQFAQNGKDI